MDIVCLENCLTETECQTFEENGFLIVENALSPKIVENLTAAVDRFDAEYRSTKELSPYDRLHMLDFVAKDVQFFDLIDWYKTFPKVWGILGWHIQLYLSHMDVTPPKNPKEKLTKKRLGLHQDSGRLNKDLETIPRPRISVKVAYFLSDTSVEGQGNFHVVPKSHLKNEIVFPEDGVSNPSGTTPICVLPGTAVIFDRRIWHGPSPNHSEITRKVLFYSYRWLRPRDNVEASRFMDTCSPIRKQLLGATSVGGHGYTSPKDEDVPLRDWIKDHLGEEAVMP